MPLLPPLAPEQTPPPMCQRLRILVADDSPNNHKLISAVLGKRGHVVDIAGNGEEAVEKVRTGEFDLVLMDVQMPIMDGYRATEMIRALDDPQKAHVPIIGVTAFGFPESRTRGLKAGMDAYVTKPIDLHAFTTLIEKIAGKDGQ